MSGTVITFCFEPAGWVQGEFGKFELVTTTDHSSEVHNVAFSPDGRFLVSASLPAAHLWSA
jgi:WD40 repeat protein